MSPVQPINGSEDSSRLYGFCFISLRKTCAKHYRSTCFAARDTPSIAEVPNTAKDYLMHCEKTGFQGLV